MGYRGHDYDGGAVTVHVDKRRRGRTSQAQWRWMKRRAAVEPSIGHLKSEHRLERNRLKGTIGNEINAILAAAAMNFQKPLQSFLAHFSVRPDASMERLARPARPASPQYSTSICLKKHFFRID